MTGKINIGLVGLGKIAHDQHVPALLSSPHFDLIAVTRGTFPPPPGAKVYESLDAMLRGEGDLNAVTLCTPPQGRHLLAQAALDAGLHVMLEKPPGQTVAHVEELIATAARRGVALFASWHSREAPAVEPARAWISQGALRAVNIVWREDVRRWHPGQQWIWNAGGMGVFDAGINALSIVTRLVPDRLSVRAARLSIPGNRSMPIAADIDMTDANGTPLRAQFDWRQHGEQTWTITIERDRGRLVLSAGGGRLSIDGQPVALAPSSEYPSLYGHFATLVRAARIDADMAPLRLVTDCLEQGERIEVAVFED